MSAPIDVPVIMSIGMPARSNTRSTPMWAMPFAPPPLRTTATFLADESRADKQTRDFFAADESQADKQTRESFAADESQADKQTRESFAADESQTDGLTRVV